MRVSVGVGALFLDCIFPLSIESMKSWYLSRRVFLVDMLSGREKSISSVPKVIRVATSIKIRWAWVRISLLSETNTRTIKMKVTLYRQIDKFKCDCFVFDRFSGSSWFLILRKEQYSPPWWALPTATFPSQTCPHKLCLWVRQTHTDTHTHLSLSPLHYYSLDLLLYTVLVFFC